MKKKQRKIVTILCFFLCDKDTLVVFDKFFDGFYITQTTSIFKITTPNNL